MKISKTLSEWLAIKQLTLFQLLSISFVPRRTLEDIIKGENRIPAQYRLYFVTKLDEFRLSESQLEQYATSKKDNPKAEVDELICDYFNQLFVDQQVVPSQEDTLVFSESKYQDKKVLTKTLLDKYFSSKSPGRSVTKSIVTDSNHLGFAVQELISVLSGSDSAIQEYKQKNKTGLKNLRSLVGVFFDENPGAAYKQIAQTENLFS